jgi:Domain of unknown function (DUF4148)
MVQGFLRGVIGFYTGFTAADGRFAPGTVAIASSHVWRFEIMNSIKSLIEAAVIAALIAAPLAAFAQSNPSNEPVTRAQVRAELSQLEKAGYDPSNASADDYPANIQAAEAKVSAQKQAVQNSGYGTSANGSSQQSRRTDFAPSSYSVPVVNYTR